MHHTHSCGTVSIYESNKKIDGKHVLVSRHFLWSVGLRFLCAQIVKKNILDLWNLKARIYTKTLKCNQKIELGNKIGKVIVNAKKKSMN